LYADCCCYSLTGVSSPNLPELSLSICATAKNNENKTFDVLLNHLYSLYF